MPANLTRSNMPVGLALLALTFPVIGAEKAAISSAPPPVLWRNPTDIASRDLFYGPGGRQHQPHGPFTFVKEDLEGSNPKFTVRDRDGVKWKVKLGLEAQPETVASRIVWAAGYFADEDYFVPGLPVTGLPVLQRGQEFADLTGSVHNARLKREQSRHKVGTWQWRADPFFGTREWNGLRIMMALINNWDLKDENNAILQEGRDRIYMISDLGASFGSAGRAWPYEKGKGDLETYSRSRFIRRITPAFVNFETPARPQYEFVVNPKEYLMRVHLEWIRRDIPRADARWMGQILARLSPHQIQDAFRAAGYSPREVSAFAEIVAQRIDLLTDL